MVDYRFLIALLAVACLVYRRRPSLLVPPIGYGAIIIVPTSFPRFLHREARCSSRVNYAEVRRKVEHAFAEKAHELHQSLALVQSLSKATLQVLDKLDTHCGASLREAEAALESFSGGGK